ncbi:hypothetical protein BaRGS_00017035, partial [Batillaria attramentaria]
MSRSCETLAQLDQRARQAVVSTNSVPDLGQCELRAADSYCLSQKAAKYVKLCRAGRHTYQEGQQPNTDKSHR